MNARADWKLLNLLHRLDDVTRAEIDTFIEFKSNEWMKIKADLLKDLRDLGEDSFNDPNAYNVLKKRYELGKAGRKKLAILEQERLQWCR